MIIGILLRYSGLRDGRHVKCLVMNRRATLSILMPSVGDLVEFLGRTNETPTISLYPFGTPFGDKMISHNWFFLARKVPAHERR